MNLQDIRDEFLTMLLQLEPQPLTRDHTALIATALNEEKTMLELMRYLQENPKAEQVEIMNKTAEILTENL